jgi:hypothetical protein
MITFLDKPFLNLDQFLDIDELDRITDDIILGIAKSRSSAGPSNSGPGYVDKRYNSIPEIQRAILEDQLHPYYNIIKNLKGWEAQTFIQYKWPSHVLGNCILLRMASSYDSKDLEKNTIDLPAIKHFESLMTWIRNQNIFKEIGRTVILLNDPFSKAIEHSDYADGVSRKDQFIWLNPLQRKKFFVKDANDKHYVTSKVAFFDSANIHGTDPSEVSTFSIRVDGKFTKEFLTKTGLESYLYE